MRECAHLRMSTSSITASARASLSARLTERSSRRSAVVTIVSRTWAGQMKGCSCQSAVHVVCGLAALDGLQASPRALGAHAAAAATARAGRTVSVSRKTVFCATKPLARR